MVGKFIFILIFTGVFGSCFSQSSDLLVLKKKSKAVKTFFPGSEIIFRTEKGISKGLIDVVEKDSLFLLQYDIRWLPTLAGLYYFDTVAIYRFKVNYHDIRSFLMSNDKKFNWSGSGGALFGGGTLLTTVGLGTWLFTKKNSQYYASPYLVGAASLLAATGYLLVTSGNKELVIGDKYSLHYIPLQ
ncbi:hypothetical protein BH20BAC1_BH20BAC1_15330 [soil metagenome]